MNDQTNLHTKIIITVIVLFFIPNLILSAFSIGTVPLSHSWTLLALGLMLSATGSIGLIVSFRQWEAGFWTQLDSLAQSKANMLTKKTLDHSKEGLLPPSDERVEVLSQQMLTIEERNQQLQKEKSFIEAELTKIQHELKNAQSSQTSQSTQTNDVLAEYKGLIDRLKNEVNDKNQRITDLEVTIADLNYELKTLLQVSDFGVDILPTPSIKETNIIHEKETPLQKEKIFTDVDHFPPPYPPEDAQAHAPQIQQQHTPIASGYVSVEKPLIKVTEEVSKQLKRCLEIAQKMTGSTNFGSQSRFRELAMENSALEERRLFDGLANEQNGVIMVYSLKDEKPLFISPEIKELSGWTHEKFLQEFGHIIQGSSEDWSKALLQLNNRPEVSLKLSLKNRNGADQHVGCVMSLIPSGIFKHYVVSILY